MSKRRTFSSEAKRTARSKSAAVNTAPVPEVRQPQTCMDSICVKSIRIPSSSPDVSSKSSYAFPSAIRRDLNTLDPRSYLQIGEPVRSPGVQQAHAAARQRNNQRLIGHATDNCASRTDLESL